ncbi:MAG TPA: hypothetical protein VMU84_14460 [Thermoanaerobaculia bacterium]|nr:hypothetical protein [Thermoanaerobaculia bacterium]
MPITLDQVTIETFEPLAGSAFTVTTPDGQAFELKLTRVAKIMERVRSKKLKRQAFSLYFEGASTFMLQQHMFTFSHPALDGELSIFLVPVGRDEETFQYEAVFT